MELPFIKKYQPSYLKDFEIEEAMSDSFVSIFKNLKQLKNLEAFEPWAKKIAVNECLQFLRKKVNFQIYLEDTKTTPQELLYEDEHLHQEDLLKLLEKLPEGCKTIFNLFVIEGFSHKEIAEQLQISEGTSKSQLNVAKNKLQVLVNHLYYSNAN